MFSASGARSLGLRKRLALVARNRRSRRSQLSLEALEARQLMAYDTVVLADEPLAYYRFEEAPGETIAENLGTLGADADGTFNNVILGNASALPALGNAGTFNSSHVRIPDVPEFNLGTGDYTIEFWFNSVGTARGDIFTYKGTGGDLGVHYASQGANILSVYHGAFRNTTPAILTTNNWYHVAIVRSGTGANELTTFINGVPLVYGASNDSWNIAQDLLIGANHNNANPIVPSTFFNGRIDEFAIYNKALTNNQIRSHVEAAFETYQSLPVDGLNPSLYYDFSETSGPTIADDSGNNHSGLIVNGATLGVPGASLQMGTAIEFNGTNQYISTAPANTLGLNGSFTASAWIKADHLFTQDVTVDRTIFGIDAASNNQGLHLILRNGQPHMGFYGNDTGSGTTLAVGEWYHITWRYDASTTEQAIYLNGALLNRETGHAAFAGTGVVNIGRWNGGNYFDGLIDEAAIFPSALPHAAILALYETGIEAHANDDSLATTEDAPLQLQPSQLLGNDKGIPGGIVSVTSNTPGAGVTLNNDGTITFDPTVFNSLTQGQAATATFTYQFVAHEDYGNRRLVIGPYGPGGTYNAYMFDPLPRTWDEARVAAYSTKLNGVSGKLVEVGSLAENNFLRDTFRNVDGSAGLEYWLGHSDSDQRSLIDLVQLLGTEAGTAPLAGWRTTTGEPITFSNWTSGEPNDSGGAEDAAQMYTTGLWNDHQAGATIGQTSHQIAAVYEFELNLASAADFVAPGFTVRQVRSNVAVGNLATAEALLAPGSANNIMERTMHYSVLNLSGDGDGHFVENLPLPFPGDGSNYATQSTGVIYIPAAGDYTFILNSDDGFRLSITGATLGTVGGQAGTANDNNSMVFTAGRGVADSVGVFNFPAPGFYPIEVIHFEGSGGDSVELSAAPGAFTAYNSNFALVGSVNGLKVFNKVPTSLLQTATVTVDVDGLNDAPTAGTVAAQSIAEGQSVTFTMVGANDVDAGEAATLTYSWDINGDGTYDVVNNTSSVTRTWAQLEALGIDGPFATNNVRVLVTDVQGATAGPVISSLTVNNAPPTLDFTGPSSGAPNVALEFEYGATDPSTADTAAGFDFDINWGDGDTETIDDATAGAIAHTFAKAGTYQVVVTATDRNGGVSNEVTLSITISPVFVDDEGNLIINGSDSNDRIILNRSGGAVQAVINGRRFPPAVPDGGRVIVLGGDGADTITVTSSVPFPVEVFGGAGNDYIAGGVQADILHGEDGNDRLLGGGSGDTLYGGNGNDTLSGAAGSDTLYGDRYLDEFGGELDGVGNDKLSGDAGNDILDGGDGNDRINGGTGNDELYGRDGNDTLSGDSGNDFLFGELGSDTLYGRDGLDVLIGGESADALHGGNGSDVILGDAMNEARALEFYAAWITSGIGNVQTLRTDFGGDIEADDMPDTLFGQGGNDWILAFLIDRPRDNRSGDALDRDI